MAIYYTTCYLYIFLLKLSQSFNGTTCLEKQFSLYCDLKHCFWGKISLRNNLIFYVWQRYSWGKLEYTCGEQKRRNQSPWAWGPGKALCPATLSRSWFSAEPRWGITVSRSVKADCYLRKQLILNNCSWKNTWFQFLSFGGQLLSCLVVILKQWLSCRPCTHLFKNLANHNPWTPKSFF